MTTSLGLNFDPNSVAPEQPAEALPVGWYTAMIESTEVKLTSKGDGKYIACEYSIIAPAEFSGRKVFDNINFQNPNDKAQEIGQRRLSAICGAIGIGAVTDTQVLHNKPLDIKLGMEKKTDEYPEPRNKITGIRAASNTATGTSGAPQPNTNAAPSGPATPSTPVTPAGPSGPAAPEPVYEDVYVHTATDFSEEVYRQNPAWTTEALVNAGHGRIEQREVKQEAPAGPSGPAAPAPEGPSGPAAPSSEGIPEKPPWQQ